MMVAELLSLWRMKRGEKRPRRGELALPAKLLAMAAGRRRNKGLYDLKTLALYRTAWKRRRSPSALLDYALYRRDLGYPLPKRWMAPLLAGLGDLRAGRRRLTLAMVAETAAEKLVEVPVKFLNEGAGRMAPLAFWSQPSGDAAALPWLARFEERQRGWREGFADLLRNCRNKGICVVGNSGSLRGAGHGDWIDGHGLVVRFNRFRCEESNTTDIGARVDVWVAAPGFPGLPPEEAEWTIVTGPDMRYRRQNWENVRSRLELDRPVLTVPLEVWRSLAMRMSAPPSAGLLMLAWMKTILGSWEGISTVGLGVATSQGTPYHHADPRQKAVERHDWEAERILLGQWRAEGLRMK